MNIRKTFLLKLFLGTTTISPKTTSVATQTLATSNTTRTTPRVWEYELGIKILANEGINQIYDTLGNGIMLPKIFISATLTDFESIWCECCDCKDQDAIPSSYAERKEIRLCMW